MVMVIGSNQAFAIVHYYEREDCLDVLDDFELVDA